MIDSCMEGKEEANAGVTMKENSYTVAPMTENPTLNPSPNLKIVQFSGNELKKKRGRPRKYAADGPEGCRFLLRFLLPD